MIYHLSDAYFKCECVCVSILACMFVEAREHPQVPSPRTTPHVFSETVSLTEPGTCHLSHLSDLKAPSLASLSLPLALRFQAPATVSSFHVSPGGLNSGPHVCLHSKYFTH